MTSPVGAGRQRSYSLDLPSSHSKNIETPREDPSTREIGVPGLLATISNQHEIISQQEEKISEQREDLEHQDEIIKEQREEIASLKKLLEQSMQSTQNVIGAVIVNGAYKDELIKKQGETIKRQEKALAEMRELLKQSTEDQAEALKIMGSFHNLLIKKPEEKS